MTVLSIENPAHVASAEAYVRSRFFPPLPVEYGALAILAINTYVESGPDAEVPLSLDLNPLPAGTFDVDGLLYVAAHRLVSALRLEHMLPDDDDEY